MKAIAISLAMLMLGLAAGCGKSRLTKTFDRVVVVVAIRAHRAAKAGVTEDMVMDALCLSFDISAEERDEYTPSRGSAK